MNKFINFKKILFSLFLLSLSFSPAFLMEDGEPMDQIELDQPASIAIEREWEQMTQEDELMLDKIIFQAFLCGHRPFTQIPPDSEHWFNFYRMFKRKIDPNANISELKLNINVHNVVNRINTYVTDDVIKAVTQRFQDITFLDISHCINITDASLRALANYHNLQSLNLSCCTKISGIGLRFTATNCHNLKFLNLTWCNITDADLHIIAVNCPYLQILNLACCFNITDDGLQALVNCPNLQHLKLNSCDQITDDGLQFFVNCPNLQILSLYNCKQITDAGIQRLKAALPNLTVLR
ncbi:hypothetical protein K9L05_00835 [Candidatus Babeliales bacterium]|nr:hypothetical protein [Candidatus Babeliales bacterium]